VRRLRRIRADGFGVAQAAGAGAFTYGTLHTWGIGIGMVVVGASWFITAVLIESLGGK
jgi:hypothetical protein